MHIDSLQGAGLGLRRNMLDEVAELTDADIDFLEVTPENWMGLGGELARKLQSLSERHAMVCHGLSLNVGGPAPLDTAFINDLKQFLDSHNIVCFSEHLSYCGDDGHLYDLMPIPFTDEAVHYVAQRIRQVQDQLQRRIAIENVSYYAAPAQQLSEIEFVKAVVVEADCDLLLDVNNVYVNSVNHVYDAQAFIAALPAHRIAYLHIAGHYRESETLIVDTHGAEVIDPVWQLLDYTYQNHGIKPTLLERDFNLPPLAELLQEVNTIGHYQQLQETRYA
ncbi:MAG: DUF692 domain-containing protein [Gammaproteobacteria bacterium]|nr:MAG: DUF692 domain-containing protein [Gammaproteobacteria bacterium]